MILTFKIMYLVCFEGYSLRQRSNTAINSPLATLAIQICCLVGQLAEIWAYDSWSTPETLDLGIQELEHPVITENE